MGINHRHARLRLNHAHAGEQNGLTLALVKNYYVVTTCGCLPLATLIQPINFFKFLLDRATGPTNRS